MLKEGRTNEIRKTSAFTISNEEHMHSHTKSQLDCFEEHVAVRRLIQQEKKRPTLKSINTKHWFSRE
jgi:hypothetical protein